VENNKDSSDLTKITGIGKKTANILREGSITSIGMLANADSASIIEIFERADYHYQITSEAIDAWIQEAARFLEGSPPVAAPVSSQDDSTPEEYLEDPLYDEILVSYQNAEWDVCIEKLEVLTQKYPDEQALARFFNEVKLQSALHAEGMAAISEEKKARRLSKSRNLFISAVVFVVLVILGMVAVPFVQNVIETARIEQEIQDRNELLAKLYSNAENFLEAGRPSDAQNEIEKIRDIDPAYPGLDALLLEIQQQNELADLYETATSLQEENDLRAALDVFLQIEEIDPYYKDIEQKINFLETETSYQDWVALADQAFRDRDWQEAVDGYEVAFAMRVSAPYDYVEDNLYDSYLNQIMEMLQRKDLSLDEIETAETYYKNALSLKPQDLESLDQREALKKAVTDLLVDRLILSAQELIAEGGVSDENFTAAEGNLNNALGLDPESAVAALQIDLFNRYKSGLERFFNGQFEQAANSLEYLYQREIDYAGGGAAYLLYESYFAIGKDWLEKGRYGEALGEFQRSEIMALKNPENSLPILQSREMVAHTLGKLGSYEDAAFHYAYLIETYSIFALAEESIPELHEALLSAEEEMEENKFREAYLAYEKAMTNISSILEFDSTLAVSGDSIPSIAFQFNSTIQAIIEANNLPNQYIIMDDGVYLIPIFMADQNE
jgi:tetratricopeptide (TPR) repeat protein